MGITAYGYETTPKEDIKKDVQKIFTTALGEDLDLSDETPQGNLINGFTDMLHQIDMHRQSDFYARDLNKAVGNQLDIIGRELGLPRKQSVPTQILVNIAGALSYRIPAGTLANIVSNSSQVFQFTNEVAINSSVVQATLTATDGAVYKTVSVSQKLQTQEYIPQIYSITVASVVPGLEAESDYVYRTRLLEAKSANTDEVEHFTLALEAIPNVLSAYVEPNNTLETSDTGIPPHAVEITVLGGAEADIGQVIMSNIFATPTYKRPTYGQDITVTDYNGHEQTFHITRPVSKTINVNVQYTNKPGETLTTDMIDEIKTKIREYISSVYMNKTLYVSDIYNIVTEGMTRIFSINELAVMIGSGGQQSGIAISYTCKSYEYLSAGMIAFTEV